MQQKTKKKIQKIIFMLVTMIGFGFCGGFAGYSLATVEKAQEKKTSPGMALLLLAGFALLLFLAYFLQIMLHETGHLIFGLLTGYRFSSIRFGSLILIKKDGKLCLKRMKVAGTAGQCLLLPPEGDETEFPTSLYNLGGLIVNFLVSGICLFFYFRLSQKVSVAGLLLYLVAVLGFTIFLTNALPFSEMGTDGANTLLLKKSKEARRAFGYALRVTEALANGKEIGEMPLEWFSSDTSVPLDNPLVTGQAVNRFGYLMEREQYEEAYSFGESILENAVSIHMLHKGTLHLELLFMDMVIFCKNDKAKEAYKKNEKEFRQLAGLICCPRVQYAYYTLCEPNEKKAAQQKRAFEALAKHYPYPQEVRNEKKLFEMVEKRLLSTDGKQDSQASGI